MDGDSIIRELILFLFPICIHRVVDWGIWISCQSQSDKFPIRTIVKSDILRKYCIARIVELNDFDFEFSP